MISNVIPLLGQYLSGLGDLIIACTALGIVCVIPKIIRYIVGR